MSLADELVARLGIEIAPNALPLITKFKQQFDSIRTHAAVALAAVAAQLGVVSVAFNQFIDEANALQTLADKTGVATDSLQEWDYIAKQAGVSAEAIKNDLVSITKAMASPIPGQLNMGMLMFGVSVRKANGELKTSDEILTDISDKLSTLSPQRAQQWGQKLGLSSDTVVALRQGSAAIEQLKQQARDFGGVIPEKAIKQAVLYQQKLNDLKWSFRGLTTALAIGVLPIFNQVIDVFRLWIVLNKEWLALRTTAMVEGLYRTFVTLKRAFDETTSAAKPISEAIEGVTGSFTDANTWGHLFLGLILTLAGKILPFILRVTRLTAVITALSYVAEDLFMLFTGGESAIGTLFDKLFTRFPKLKTQLTDFKQTFSATWDTLSDRFGDFVTSALPVLQAGIGKLVELFAALASGVLTLVTDRLKLLNEFFSTFTSRYPYVIEGLKALAHFFGTVLAGAVDIVVTLLNEFFSIVTAIKNTSFTALTKALDFVNDTLGDWFFDKDKPKQENDKQPTAGSGREQLPDNTQNVIPSFRAPVSNKANEKGLLDQIFGPAQFIPPQPARQALPSSAFPQRERQERPQIIDNRTINQTITTSDPKRAADLALEGIAASAELQTSNPGMFAPTVG